MIPFFTDKIHNETFNKIFTSVLQNYPNEEDQELMQNLILDYSKTTPQWTLSVATQILNIVDMELQLRKFIRTINESEKGPSRDKAETLSRYINAIKIAKEQLGIDPKSLASKGDGSISESFADMASKVKFDKKRFVCKPIFGMKNKDSITDVDEFKHLDDDKIEDYLQTAKTE